MYSLIPLFLLADSPLPVKVIPQEKDPPASKPSEDPINIKKIGNRDDNAAPGNPEAASDEVKEKQKQIDALKGELAKLQDELKKEREKHSKELADAVEKLEKVNRELNALKEARAPQRVTAEKPFDGPRANDDKVRPAVNEPSGKDESQKTTLPTLPTPIPADVAFVRITTTADAKITIDGVEMKTTGTERVFRTPTLAPGRLYDYTVVAERMVDGKPTRISRAIQVRPGTQMSLDLVP
jgi:uncharacterized protein (TIGR03000 family)